MNMRYGILSERAEDVGPGRKNILGTIDHFSAADFPTALLQLSLTLKFEAATTESGEHRLSLRFVDADHNDVMNPIPILFEIAPRSPDFPDSPALCAITVEISGLVVPKPGYHEFLIAVDHEYIGNVPLYAYRMPANPNNPDETQ